MSILENHTVKYKPFVNPFYKEGIGRRTGAVLKTEVRKDSDGFEIFDDYFSESEAENSELSFAVDKENISANANVSRRTGRQKLLSNQKRSSPLRPMKSFSPAASTDRSVVKSSDDISTSKNGEETQGNSGNPERDNTDADAAQDEETGSSEVEVSLSEKESRESSSEEEAVPGFENKTVPARGVAGKHEAEMHLSDKENRESSSEEEAAPGLEENKTVPAREVTSNSETEIEPSNKENRESSSEDEVVPELEENKALPAMGVAQEVESEEVREAEKDRKSEDEEKAVSSKDDMTQKDSGLDEVKSNEDGASSERNSSDAEREKMKNPEVDISSVKKQPNVDSPLQGQIFAMTKKRLSFSGATEDVSTSSHKGGSKAAMNKEEKMNNILENPDKEELVGESQEKPSFMDMINSKRTSGAVFSFRFSEILSSTAYVSDQQSDQPDDDNVVIVSEQNEKSFLGKTGRKRGMKESAKSKVGGKNKSENRRKSKGAGKKLTGSGKVTAKSGSEDSGSNETTVAEMETKDETMQKKESLEKSRMVGGSGKNKDSVQSSQVDLDGTSQVSDTRKGTAGSGDSSHNTDVVACEDTDMNHVPDAMEGEDQVFVEASEGQSTIIEIRKEDAKVRRSSRRGKSTSREEKEQEKAPLKSVKEDSRTERKGSDLRKSSRMEKVAATMKGNSDEDEDQSVINDTAGQSTTEVRKETAVKRRSSRRTKSTSMAKKEKNNQSRVKENSRIERDGSVSKGSSEMEKTAAAEVNSDEDEIVIGDSEVNSTSGIEKEGNRKRRSSRPLKSTSKAKKEKRNNQSRVKEESKMERKGSDPKMPLEVEKTVASERDSNEDEDQIVIGDLEDGSTRGEKNEESSVSKISSEMDVETAPGRKKSVSTAGKGRRKSKKQESESASQEDEDATLVKENAATNVSRQRQSKRIRSKTESESESERDESQSDKELRNLQRKSMKTKKDKRVKEIGGRVEKDGPPSSEEAEALKEQKSSSSQSEDETMDDKKLTKKSQVKERKSNRSKAGRKKNLSLEEDTENGKNSQLEETKNKRTRRTKSLASFVHDNRNDEETKQDKEIDGEDDKEEEIAASEDEVQEDGSSKVGSDKSQEDKTNTAVEVEVKGTSRKRKSTSLHSTKIKVKRGDKSKVERINNVKKTLDYTEENSIREEVANDGDELVDNDGTVEGDGVPTDPGSDKTSPDRVSPSLKNGDDPGDVEDIKNDSSDQQQAGSSIPQSILKSSKVYRKHRKHRRQRNLRLTFHEIAKPKAWIIPPNREQKGERRSNRNRVRPLEYWRNERAVYERRKSGGFALMGINSPEHPSDPYQKSRRGRKKQKVGMHTRLLTPKNLSLHRSAPDNAVPGCSDPVVVVNPESQREVLVDVVKTPLSNVYVGPSGNHASDTDSFILTKALMQPAFSSGILTIRPEREKGLQLVQRDTMVFHIVRGKVAVTIHQTTQILESGAFFFVPQGNVYNIVNLRKDDAKLVFFQLKGSDDV